MTPVVMMLAPQKTLACKKRGLKNGEGKNSLLFAHAKRFGDFFYINFTQRDDSERIFKF